MYVSKVIYYFLDRQLVEKHAMSQRAIRNIRNGIFSKFEYHALRRIRPEIGLSKMIFLYLNCMGMWGTNISSTNLGCFVDSSMFDYPSCVH